MVVLAVGAHPDDIDTYCSGTLAKYAALGHKVYMCIAANGCCGTMDMARDEIVKIRRKEAQASADIIGAALIWMDYDDAVLFQTPEVRTRFLHVLQSVQPDVVLTHTLVDYNPDHSETARIMRDVVGLLGLRTEHTMEKTPVMYCWELQSGMGFIPTEYVDISDFFETKKRMMACHHSQISLMKELFRDSYDDPAKGNFFEGIEIQARYRGLQCGAMYAEGFVRANDAFRVCAGTLLP